MTTSVASTSSIVRCGASGRPLAVSSGPSAAATISGRNGLSAGTASSKEPSSGKQLRTS